MPLLDIIRLSISMMNFGWGIFGCCPNTWGRELAACFLNIHWKDPEGLASVLKIEADPNAQSFYERMGARKVGEHHSEVFGQPRTLPVMEVAV